MESARLERRRYQSLEPRGEGSDVLGGLSLEDIRQALGRVIGGVALAIAAGLVMFLLQDDRR